MDNGQPRRPKTALAVLLVLFGIMVTAIFILKETGPVGRETRPKPAAPKERKAAPAPRSVPESSRKVRAFPGSAGTAGEIAVIIDDVGWNRTLLSQLEPLRFPVTLAVLPDTPFGEEIARKARASRRLEVILHIPLEPLNAKKIGKQEFLRISMDDDEIRLRVDGYLKRFEPYIVGVNNHMGSAFTASEKKMRVLLGELKERDLFFVDSVTNPASCGAAEAKNLGVPTARRDVFLDNVNSTESIEENIGKMKRIAAAEGSVVAIGHDRPLTIQALKKHLPALAEEGYRIAFVSNVLK